MANASSRTLIACLILATAVFIAFSPTLRNGFTGYDDPDYVLDNVHVRTGLSAANVKWAFTQAHVNNWHPLTWISHALDVSLFGLAPAGHHLISLLLHIANTLLLFLWLSGATGRPERSAFVALAFGLHPAHVESVAWVAERKDVLSTFFWMLTLLAYSAYSRRPGWLRYLLVALLLCAGLMSKQMVVTVPLLLLVLDWWPIRRPASARRLVLEKLPLLLLSFLASATAIWAQRLGGAVAPMDLLPLWLRLSNGALSHLRYLAKTVWPDGLSVFYPFPLNGIAAWKVAGSVIALAAIFALVFALRGRHPWLAVGWCWYFLTLLPVIGIVQVGMQAMADRYLYVPMIGLLIAVAWECAEHWGARRWLPIASATALLALGVVTWRQVHVWKDGLTLFEHAVAVTTDNFVAHDNLGVELDRRGRSGEALAQYRETLRIRPGDRHGEQNYAMASFAKGERLFVDGKPHEAMAALQDGLRYRPDNAVAHMYVGLILGAQRRTDAQMTELRTAIALDPALARAHMALGVLLNGLGRYAEALQEFQTTIRYDPSNVEAHYNAGSLLAVRAEYPAALAQFDAAIGLKPDFAPALLGRLFTLYGMERFAECRQALEAARAAKVGVPPEFVAELSGRLRR